jgi:hypothetical protein
MAPALIFEGPLTPEKESFEFLPSSKHAAFKSQLSRPESNTNLHTLASDSVPPVSKLDINNYTSEDALVSDIIESMKLSGGCIVQNLISTPTLQAMKSEIRPYLDTVEKADCKSIPIIPLNIMCFFLLAKFITDTKN